MLMHGMLFVDEDMVAKSYLLSCCSKFITVTDIKVLYSAPSPYSNGWECLTKKS